VIPADGETPTVISSAAAVTDWMFDWVASPPAAG
jgi:hypothetical protein